MSLALEIDPAPTPAHLFQAFADPARRRIFEMLVAGVQDIGELARRSGLSRAMAGYHLGVLQRAGLVRRQRFWAEAKPDNLELLRRYFDVALTVAAISSPSR